MTHLDKLDNESLDNFHRRYIVHTLKWYTEHLKDYPVVTILLTNNKELRDEAQSLTVLSMKEYLHAIGDKELLNSLQHESYFHMIYDNDGSDINKEKYFEDHLSQDIINEKIKDGLIYTGPFRQNRYNWLEGNVPSDKLDNDILIKGWINRNRAIDGDLVAVELFPEDQWESSSMYIIDSDAPYIDQIKENDNNFLKGVSSQFKRPTGKVVGIIRKNWREYVGSIVHDDSNNQTLFIPIDRRIPKIQIKLSEPKELVGKRVIVIIDGWDENSLLPYGHYVRTIGNIGDKEAEEESILFQNDIHLKDWEPEILQELPPPDSPVEMTEERTDLRHICIFSVDPPGCTDIDDALHARKLDNGNYEVGVHIADVTHYVKEGSNLDQRAKNSGTSVYLVDRRINMIPSVLSENLCSLNCNVDRYAFSVIWEMTKEGEIVDTNFFKSVIRSRASLSYEEAQKRIDDSSLNDEITEGLRELRRFSQILKRKRIENGSLTLASTAVKFVKDEETQDPIDIELYESKDTNSLVEEFMLLANISVAKKILKHYPSFALLRRHPPPSQEKLTIMSKSISRLIDGEVKFDASNSKALSESLDEARRRLKDDSFDKVVRIMTTRCMDQARYFSSGTLDPSKYAHYGLATPIYTHFTSPIRRYPDIIVHRLLGAAIGISSLNSQLTQRNIKTITDIVNRRHRLAQIASRDSVRFKTIEFFEGKITTEKAYVTQVACNAISVMVLKYGIEGTLYLSDNPDDIWILSDDRCEVKSPCGNFVLRVFDIIDVQFYIDSSKEYTKRIVFHCINPKIHKEIENIPTLKNGQEDLECPDGEVKVKKNKRDRTSNGLESKKSIKKTKIK